MEVYKKKRLPRVIATLTMLLFVIGLTMNVLFCGTYNLYELSDRATAAETWTTVADSWATTVETCTTAAESWAATAETCITMAEPWITTAETCTTATGTWTNPEGIKASREAVNPPIFRSPLLDKNNFHTETITKNICPIPAMAAIPKGFFLLPIPGIALLHFFLTSFITLPDELTLINQKIRLDN